jgi:hypothetical protein
LIEKILKKIENFVLNKLAKYPKFHTKYTQSQAAAAVGKLASSAAGMSLWASFDTISAAGDDDRRLTGAAGDVSTSGNGIAAFHR